MQIPSAEWRGFTHKQRRVLINKERRRRRRKRNAIVREDEERAVQAQLESEADYLERLVEAERLKAEEERKEEARRLLDHETWLERERVAAEEYSRKRELEEKRKRDKEERERLIREEWEILQTREKQVEEKRERTRREKEERLKVALNVDLEPGSQPWHNPLAPLSTMDANFGTEKDTHNCAFFLKTGACRFGDRCSKQHPHPTSSVTLLIPGMFESFGLKEQMLDERDQDTGLEFDEREQFAQFEAFYKDVLPEFFKAGKVVQFKVSCNHEPHLRGNVYVQYLREEECAEAFRIFNGRWYAQRQLSCEYCPVQKWKTAICGLFDRGRCPKGKHCNFLHVFRNPGGEFDWADRDLPEPSMVSERRTSPQRSRKERHRSHSRESRDSSRGTYRSHSRESRGSTRDLHRSHSRDTPSDRHRSHSRDTPSDLHQSHSRDIPSDRHQSHSRDTPSDRHRSHSNESTHRSHSRESSHKQHKKKHKHKIHSSSSPLVTKAVAQDGLAAASATTPSTTLAS